MVEVLGVAATPVTHLACLGNALGVGGLSQEHHVGAIGALLALAVVVVGISVGARPPERKIEN